MNSHDPSANPARPLAALSSKQPGGNFQPAVSAPTGVGDSAAPSNLNGPLKRPNEGLNNLLGLSLRPSGQLRIGRRHGDNLLPALVSPIAEGG
ncbi:MAG: hypothetical protein ACLPKB_12865, partial [Xanthobacteraceae bacterium]